MITDRQLNNKCSLFRWDLHRLIRMINQKAPLKFRIYLKHSYPLFLEKNTARPSKEQFYSLFPISSRQYK